MNGAMLSISSASTLNGSQYRHNGEDGVIKDEGMGHSCALYEGGRVGQLG